MIPIEERLKMRTYRKIKKIKIRVPIGPSPKVIESKKYKKEKHKKKISEDDL